MKKMICLMIVVCLTSSVCAADVIWVGGGGDDQWDTAANWGGTLPGSGDKAGLNDGADVDLNTAQAVATLWMGASFGTGTKTLNIGTDGALATTGTQFWGNGGTAIINMTGNGSLTASGFTEMAVTGGSAFLNMSDDSVLTHSADNFRVGTTKYGAGTGVNYGRVYLDDNAYMTAASLRIGTDGDNNGGGIADGLVTVAGNSTLKVSSLLIGSSGNLGQLDIMGGSLILSGEITDVTSFGNVTAYNGGGTFAYSYDGGEDLTTITAIPEPITMALLGFGGLFLRRRK